MLSNPKKQPKRDMYEELRRRLIAAEAAMQEYSFALIDADSGSLRLYYAHEHAVHAASNALGAIEIADTLLNVKRNTDEQVELLKESIEKASRLRHSADYARRKILNQATWPDGGASTNPPHSGKRRLMR